MYFKFDIGITRIGQHNIEIDQRKAHEVNTTKAKDMVICFCKDPGHTYTIPRILIDGIGIECVNQAKVRGSRGHLS